MNDLLIRDASKIAITSSHIGRTIVLLKHMEDPIICLETKKGVRFPSIS